MGPKEKQATFTGAQQRAGVWILMFLVAGLFRPSSRRRPPSRKKAKNVKTTSGSGKGKAKQGSTFLAPRPPAHTGPCPPHSTGISPAGRPAASASVLDEPLADNNVDMVDDIIASLLGLNKGDFNGGSYNSDADTSTDGGSGSTTETDLEPEPSTKVCQTPSGEEDAPAGTTSFNDDFLCVSNNLAFDWVAYRAKFGDTPYDVAVTQMFVRYAQLVDRLTGTYHCRLPMSVPEAEEVAALSRSFVLDFLTPILGKFFSTKVHKVLAHVLAAIKLHGAIKNGDTGCNESLHGHEKRRYGRTNGDEDSFRGQLLRVGQGSLEIQARVEREAADFDDWFEDVNDADADGSQGAPPSSAAVPPVAPARQRAGRRAAAVTLSELSMRPGLGAVGSALGLSVDTTLLRLPNSYTFSPRFPCCTGGHPLQHLRATLSYRGLPWFDSLTYALPGDPRGVLHYGEARAIVRKAGDHDIDVVVVAEMDVCESMPGCPLVGGGCKRLCWSMEIGDDWPSLRAIPLTSVLRLEHVLPDQDQITRDYGISATPKTVPDTPAHRRAQRFFVNAFYPWP